jgi:hypothetical protein
MFDSKRFLAFLIAVGMFVSMVYFTDHTPMEIAGAVSMICGIYIGGETIRSSYPSNTKDTTTTTDSTTTNNNITTAVNTVETKKN